MDYQKLRPAFLSLNREEQLALVLAVRNSRLTIKEKQKKKSTKVSIKQQKLIAMLQELSDDEKTLLLEEFGGD